MQYIIIGERRLQWSTFIPVKEVKGNVSIRNTNGFPVMRDFTSLQIIFTSRTLFTCHMEWNEIRLKSNFARVTNVFFFT